MPTLAVFQLFRGVTGIEDDYLRL